MDRGFDILNSKSKFGRGSKEAITSENIADKEEALDEFCAYLLGLTLADGQPLSTCRRKTFVIGFVTTAHTAISLARNLLTMDESFEYFLTFKLSQDPIETLFSKIRRMGGNNNNPNVNQFMSALKKLIVKQEVNASQNANALAMEGSTSVFALKWSKRTSPTVMDIADDEGDSDLGLLFDRVSLTDSHVNILYYIAGYIEDC